MVAKDGLVSSLSAAEVEFLAENELVKDDYGPLRTNQPATIPLWLARQLKRSRMCRMIAPDWLEVSYLETILAAEIAQRDDFQSLPFHYLEMASLILDSAADDVPRSEQVRILIQRLREQRNGKIQAGLPMIDGNPLKLNNVGHMELNEIRPFLLSTLNCFSTFTIAEEQEQLSRTTHNYSNPIRSSTTTTTTSTLFPPE